MVGRLLMSWFWTISLGAIVGFSGAALLGVLPPLLGPIYDLIQPVATVQVIIKERTPDSVVIHVNMYKHRACEYLRMSTYATKPTGTLVDTILTRVDLPYKAESKPIGEFDLGYWDIRPTKFARGIVLYVVHSCDGRLVATKLEEIAL